MNIAKVNKDTEGEGEGEVRRGEGRGGERISKG